MASCQNTTMQTWKNVCFQCIICLFIGILYIISQNMPQEPAMTEFRKSTAWRMDDMINTYLETKCFDRMGLLFFSWLRHKYDTHTMSNKQHINWETVLYCHKAIFLCSKNNKKGITDHVKTEKAVEVQ